MNVFDQVSEEVPRIGAGPRLAAVMLDYLLNTLAVMVAAWNGWGWSAIVEQLPGSEEFTELYTPMEEALVAAGMVNGVAGLLAATALLGLVYPLIEGLTGASPGKWALGLQVGRPNGHRGNVACNDAFCREVHPSCLGCAGGLDRNGIVGVVGRSGRVGGECRHAVTFRTAQTSPA